MKRASILILAMTAAALSPAAFAGGDSGLYIGGSVGTTDAEDRELDLDDSDTGYKLFGGYNFGVLPFLNIAAELAYVDLGKWEDESGDLSIDSDAWTLSGLVGFDMGPIGLFGKVGYFAWDSEAKFDGGRISDDGTDPAYGIGAKFQIGSFAVRAEYEVFELDESDVDFYSVGAAYTF